MRSDEERRLLAMIDQVSFAMDDLRLFLDTHPQEQEAVEYFRKLSVIREKSIVEYTSKFGPINAYYVNNSNEWQWNTCPYPWEVE